ncbi:hypothetical protein V1511DRAFT_489938 [Dipodascopsis uninucleata]
MDLKEFKNATLRRWKPEDLRKQVMTVRTENFIRWPEYGSLTEKKENGAHERLNHTGRSHKLRQQQEKSRQKLNCKRTQYHAREGNVHKKCSSNLRKAWSPEELATLFAAERRLSKLFKLQSRSTKEVKFKDKYRTELWHLLFPQYERSEIEWKLAQYPERLQRGASVSSTNTDDGIAYARATQRWKKHTKLDQLRKSSEARETDDRFMKRRLNDAMRRIDEVLRNIADPSLHDCCEEELHQASTSTNSPSNSADLHEDSSKKAFQADRPKNLASSIDLALGIGQFGQLDETEDLEAIKKRIDAALFLQ